MHTSVSSAKSEIVQAKARLEKAIEAICDIIKGLPDNPDITRISDQPSVFIMQKSALDKPDAFGRSMWSSEFHDFRQQYQAVATGLRCNADTFDSWWLNCAEQRKVRLYKAARSSADPGVHHLSRPAPCYIPLHATVIKTVSELLI